MSCLENFFSNPDILSGGGHGHGGSLGGFQIPMFAGGNGPRGGQRYVAEHNPAPPQMMPGKPSFFSYGSGGHSTFSPSVPTLKYYEMSPETTLVEFISTSASYHGVKRQNVEQLEWDILQVFPNNIMPANAAAWYMAKRRYYANNTLEFQLLTVTLKNFPNKFQLKGTTVEFLEVYSKEVARKKMQQMIRQGTVGYFNHKVDEYGVYFFDPFYYENTEPFHANLRQVTNCHRSHRVKLIPQFFAMHKDKFVFNKHSPYLVTISREPVEVKINVTCVVVSMVDNQYGILQFFNGSTTEKAFFSAKSLLKDGFHYNGDPMRLPHMQFDGYRIPARKGESREYTWFAVLVWCGRKPNPKYCSTKEDLASSPFFQNSYGTTSYEDIVTKAIRGAGGIRSHEPVISDCMQVGEVLEIRKDGAVVSLRKDSDEKAFIPGWSHKNIRHQGTFLVTTQGVELALKDLIAYYIDPTKLGIDGGGDTGGDQKQEFQTIGCNVMVLKHFDAPAPPNSPAEFTAAEAVQRKKKNRDRKLSAKSTGNTTTTTGSESTSGGEDGDKRTGKKSDKKISSPAKPSHLDFLFTFPVDEEDVYDSDVDPPFIPPTYMPDSDLDYDEYSDDQICESEVDELNKDAKEDFDKEAVLNKMRKAEEEEAAKAKKEETEEDFNVIEFLLTVPVDETDAQDSDDPAFETPVGSEVESDESELSDISEAEAAELLKDAQKDFDKELFLKKMAEAEANEEKEKPKSEDEVEIVAEIKAVAQVKPEAKEANEEKVSDEKKQDEIPKVAEEKATPAEDTVPEAVPQEK